MTKPLFTGVCTALVTPFLKGNINYPMLQVLLRRQYDAGIRAVVLAGTTGEAPTLTDDEKLRLLESGREAAPDDMLVITGTGSNSTEHAVSMSRAAQEHGADALLVVSPYYNKANEEGLFAHYCAIAHNVSIPVIIYNVPSRTGVDIPVSVYQRLSAIANIAGVKEASGSIQKVLSIRAACPALPIWTGNDDMTVSTMALGGNGVISVAANAEPAKMKKMTDAALRGDFLSAAAAQIDLFSLTELCFCDINPMPIKEILFQQGFDCGGCRLPLTGPSTEKIRKIRSFLMN